jgi:hypothetical protein
MRARPIIDTRVLLLALLAALGLAASVGATPALAGTAAPRWDILASAAPTNLPPGGNGELVAVVTNLGDAPVIATEEDPVTITDTVPAGLEATGAMSGFGELGAEGVGVGKVVTDSELIPLVKCKQLPASCSFIGTLPPYIAIEVHIPVSVKAAPTEENNVKVEGGVNEEGGGPVTAVEVTRPLKVSAEKTPFGVELYELNAEKEDGEPDLEAGTHPFALTTTLQLNQAFGRSLLPEAKVVPEAPELLKNLRDDLPPGLLGNITVLPQCSNADFSLTLEGNSNACPPQTAVGVAVVTFNEPIYDEQETSSVPVFNLTPAAGEPARFGFEFEKVPAILDTAVRTGEGYGVEVTSRLTTQLAGVLSTVVTIWGEPASESHDNARGWECLGKGYKVEGLGEHCEPLKEANPKPYLTLPTYCSAQKTTVEAQSWKPGAEYTPALEPEKLTSLESESCPKLEFEPSLSVRPDESAASTPSGLTVEASVPQVGTLAAGGHAEADVKETTLVLPPEMAASAGAANGLETCTTAATGFHEFGASLEASLAEESFTATAAECPNASKIGTVAIGTPLLEKELTGAVYLGTQDTNPFKPQLVLYLLAEEPVTGVLVKLAGEIKLTSEGQLVSTFKNTPPVPFGSLKLHLFNGPRASQATPSRCGLQESEATLVTWSSTEKKLKPSFTPTPNPDGQPCPVSASEPLPLAASFQAGSTNSQGGAFSAFTLTIARPDGDDSLKTISVQLPPGLAAIIANVPLCPEPQAANGTCGEESLIGHSTAQDGLGSEPYTLPGKVYLTGPYDGAPFGLSSVTQAAAGPFNLGTIVVRSGITINPYTAAATINTAASQFFPLAPEAGEQTQFGGLPQFLKGTAAQIKALNVTVERPEFQFNPTNCSPLATTGTLTGWGGTTQSVSSPFEVTNCSSLPFAPKITASVVGQGSKADGTTFAVTVESPGLGQANIHKVDLTIPSLLPSRLTTIQKACVEAAFNANPASCDEGSVIGEGIVHTPVFKNPLRGPAYLVSHGGAEFPDVEFVLQGEGVTVVLDGKTYIHAGVTYSKFESAPDAPFTKFESIFPAGPHSALTPSVPEDENFNLCKQTLKLPMEITGQNGAFISQTTPVVITGCKGVLHFKVTRAEELAKALKACKTKYKAKSKKSKRVACEKAAHKKYGAKVAKKTKKKKKK